MHPGPVLQSHMGRACDPPTSATSVGLGPRIPVPQDPVEQMRSVRLHFTLAVVALLALLH